MSHIFSNFHIYLYKNIVHLPHQNENILTCRLPTLVFSSTLSRHNFVTCLFNTGMRCSSVVESLLMVQWIIRSIPHGEPTELFLIPASVQHLVKKGHGMCYPVCRMVHIKDPLLLIKKSSPCRDGSRFPLTS